MTKRPGSCNKFPQRGVIAVTPEMLGERTLDDAPGQSMSPAPFTERAPGAPDLDSEGLHRGAENHLPDLFAAGMPTQSVTTAR